MCVLFCALKVPRKISFAVAVAENSLKIFERMPPCPIYAAVPHLCCCDRVLWLIASSATLRHLVLMASNATLGSPWGGREAIGMFHIHAIYLMIDWECFSTPSQFKQRVVATLVPFHSSCVGVRRRPLANAYKSEIYLSLHY